MEEEKTVSGEKPTSDKKTLYKNIRKTASTVIVAIFVLLAILLAGARVVGFTPYAVLSPSMTPKYPVGTLVYVKKTDPELIKPGDVITFVTGENKVVATHRVVMTDGENKRFYTKGDANDDVDAPVIFENVLGRVEFSVPYLGYISIMLSKKAGRYAFLSALFLLCFVLFIPDLIKAFKEK